MMARIQWATLPPGCRAFDINVCLAAILIVQGGMASTDLACFLQTPWHPTRPLSRSSVEGPTRMQECHHYCFDVGYSGTGAYGCAG